MVTLTIYEGETGKPIDGDAGRSEAAVADHEEGVVFYFDPRAGTARVQFATGREDRPMVAEADFGERTPPSLPDLYRQIRRQVEAIDTRFAAPEGTPDHLSAVHYLQGVDPWEPDADLGEYLVATDEPVDVAAPTAAGAVGVAVFFRHRATEKSVAIHAGAGAAASTIDDADVTVVVNDAFDDVAYLGRMDPDAASGDDAADDDPATGTDGDATARADPDRSRKRADDRDRSRERASERPDAGTPTPGVDTDEGSDATDRDAATTGGTDRAAGGADATAGDDEDATGPAGTEGGDGVPDPPSSPTGPPETGTGGAAGDARRDRGGETGDTTGAREPVLRIYDGPSGELMYDSAHGGDTPSRQSEAAARYYQDSLALYVDPSGGVVRGYVQGRAEQANQQFVVEYERPGGAGDLLAAFERDLDDAIADQGWELLEDVGRKQIVYELLTDAEPLRPPGLSEEDLAWLRRADEPLDFGAPSYADAIRLVTFLREQFDGDRSMAICGAGRTEYLESTDVVVMTNVTHDRIEPRERTAVRLGERRLADLRETAWDGVEAIAEEVDAVAETVHARRQLFATALSETLTERDLAVVSGDDRRLQSRREQARYLALFGLVAAGLVAGAVTGQIGRLGSLLAEGFVFNFGPLAEAPIALLGRSYPVDAGPLLVGSLLVTVLGALWVFEPPLAPRADAAALWATFWDQVTSDGAGGTVPDHVRSRAGDLRATVDDLEEQYRRLADHEGTTAAGTEDFETFLEEELLSPSAVDVPAVELVDASRHRTRYLRSVGTGALVGGVAGLVVVGALWLAVELLAQFWEYALETLVGLAVVAAVAVIAKSIVVTGRHARGPVASLVGGGREDRSITEAEYERDAGSEGRGRAADASDRDRAAATESRDRGVGAYGTSEADSSDVSERGVSDVVAGAGSEDHGPNYGRSGDRDPGEGGEVGRGDEGAGVTVSSNAPFYGNESETPTRGKSDGDGLSLLRMGVVGLFLVAVAANVGVFLTGYPVPDAVLGVETTFVRVVVTLALLVVAVADWTLRG